MAESELVPDHENWFQCNGECEDAPRNKEFSHGFGSRYEFPLPEVKNAPVPSQIGDNQKNYKSENLSWMIEMFAQILGTDSSSVYFKYENNQPEKREDVPNPLVETALPTKSPTIIVKHSGGEASYPPQCGKTLNGRPMVKSAELERYEEAAKKSELLKLYEKNSPAGIKYFNPNC